MYRTMTLAAKPHAVRFPGSWFFPAAFLALAVYTLQDYLSWSSVSLPLGIIALACTVKPGPVHRGGWRYGIAAIAFAITGLFLPVTTVLYFALFCSLAFYTEYYSGRIGKLPLLVIIFMSPVFQYTSDVFGFPIRLQVTRLAAKALMLIDPGAVAQGNIIIFNGQHFSVDPACMGLNMLATSLLCGIMMISIYERKANKTFTWLQLLPALAAFVLFNITANLLRIVLLTLFNIRAGTAMHELSGLICLAVYALVPSAFLVRWMAKRATVNSRHIKAASIIRNGSLAITMQVFLLLVITIAAVRISALAKKATINNHAISIPGYTAVACPYDVLKLENKTELVYVKHIRGFYSTDHHPSICWRGSGYTFEEINQKKISGCNVYCAILKKDNDRLYTAWWYDNGRLRTVDQWEWRAEEMKHGSRFAIVNVTTATQQQLETSVAHALTQNTFSPAL